MLWWTFVGCIPEIYSPLPLFSFGNFSPHYMSSTPHNPTPQRFSLCGIDPTTCLINEPRLSSANCYILFISSNPTCHIAWFRDEWVCNSIRASNIEWDFCWSSENEKLPSLTVLYKGASSEITAALFLAIGENMALLG